MAEKNGKAWREFRIEKSKFNYADPEARQLEIDRKKKLDELDEERTLEENLKEVWE